MDHTEITALAEGLVPFVRECITEFDPGAAMLPPDLSAEVARAVRLLHEAPPVDEVRAAPRVVRVERDDDGNLVPIYDQPV